MKKIITLVAAVFVVASAFAQYNRDDDRYDNDKRRDAIYRDDERRDNDRLYVYDNRHRDREIYRINREYDRKIASIRDRWFMSRSKKERIIWSLEEDRKREIRILYEKYNGRRERYGDDDHHHHGRDW